MPKTCLLITTMNRTHLLQMSLLRLIARTKPDEVLVVDDGGTDGCEQACQELSDRLPLRYIYNHNPQTSICSFARNIGVRNTDAELIITSEPEVMFLTDVIPQLVEAHEAEPSSVVSAGVVYHSPREGVIQAEECERIAGWVAPFTALYRRDWLLEIGGWDESFPGSWGWDDTDLLTRLRLAGHGQVIDQRIEVLHQWHQPNQSGHKPNENHFMCKGFNEGNREHVVANKGVSWGTTKTR